MAAADAEVWPTTHTLLTEPYTPADNVLASKHEWLLLRCAADGCPWESFFIVDAHEQAGAKFAREHGDTYTRGTVPRIEVDWQPIAWCGVCPDRWTALTQEDDYLLCPTCGTEWAMDGSPGELGETFRARNGLPEA